jgi:hypothetical protein
MLNVLPTRIVLDPREAHAHVHAAEIMSRVRCLDRPLAS